MSKRVVFLFLFFVIMITGCSNEQTTTTLDESVYWTINKTKDFVYDGPELPMDIIDNDFWSESALLEVEFSKCIDGDTAYFNVTLASGYTRRESVRFVDVNTMETHHPEIGAEEWGFPGSEYTCSVLESGSEFYLESDAVQGSRDTYDRLLAYVWVDGELLQYNLMALGLADDRYTNFTGTPTKYGNLLIATQEQAELDEVGMWSDLLDPYWDYEVNRPKVD